MEIKYTIPPAYDGSEVKYILSVVLGLSRSMITALKKMPTGIMLNAERVYVTAVVKTGDELIISLDDVTSQNIVPSDIPLDIVFEDENILVLNKPRSMPTHPSQNHYTDTLANGVMNYYRDKNFTFRVITRLDKDTSGVVLIAKNKLAAARLSEAMAQRQIQKEYVALCHGVPAEKKGIIDAPIARVDNSTILREVSKTGKPAITEYEVISTNGQISLVRLTPLSGRTHQIRVHLSYIGIPIYGDDLYGSTVVGEPVRLHCKKVTLIHPMAGERMTFQAEIPDDMNKYLR